MYQLWLSWYSLCRPGQPLTQEIRLSLPLLPSAGINGMCHYAFNQLSLYCLVLSLPYFGAWHFHVCVNSLLTSLPLGVSERLHHLTFNNLKFFCFAFFSRFPFYLWFYFAWLWHVESGFLWICPFGDLLNFWIGLRVSWQRGKFPAWEKSQDQITLSYQVHSVWPRRQIQPQHTFFSLGDTLLVRHWRVSFQRSQGPGKWGHVM